MPLRLFLITNFRRGRLIPATRSCFRLCRRMCGKALPFRHGPHYIHEATPHVILSQEIILLYIS
ncbi:MAG: hypothetical protein M3539_07350, partial [Acidobacteriota bacterium]|nr:hypothetical protein [Acidobacteriota bacterium]